MTLPLALSLDDIMMVPQYSEIESRSNIDLSVDLGKGIKLAVPVLSSPMKHVTEIKMAYVLAKLGGLPVIHRFCTVEKQLAMFMEARSKLIIEKSPNVDNIACAVGVKTEDFERVTTLVEAGCKVICVDVAHGHHKMVGKMVEWIATLYKNVLLIAGNVATLHGCEYLANKGADVIRLNIGSGSICSTRIQTGFGVPQASNLYNAYLGSMPVDWHNMKWSFQHLYKLHTFKVNPETYHKRKYKIIADGGIRNSGDISKALLFSDAVMLGNLLAATNESPGKRFKKGKKWYKVYDGASTYKNKHIEGVKAAVEASGPLDPVLQRLMEGVRSALSYAGVNNLDEFKYDPPELVQITNSGLIESKPHDILIRE